MPGYYPLAFLVAYLAIPQAADLHEIVQRGTAAIQADWAANPDYAFVERDEAFKNGVWTSKTSQVVMIEGSDYYLPLAVNDEPLSPGAHRAELEKLISEIQRRGQEGPNERRLRVEDYRRQREENGSLLLEFPTAFSFKLIREDTIDGHPAFQLSASPLKRTGAIGRAVKVLSGMSGTLWLDREMFHLIRGDCHVVAPVPIYGILARVMPGTHIVLEMAPVNDKVWLVSRISMELSLSKLVLFRSRQITRTTFSDYRLNTEVIRDLLSR